MTGNRFAHAVAALAATFAALQAPAALAQAGPGGYPDKPVKIVVPFAAGGPTDIMSRLLAAKLSENTGKSFFIENQGGAGGNIGMGAVARAAPDGYTILICSPTLVVNPSLYASVPFNPLKDFVPITNVGESTHVVFVHPSVPAKSIKELIDHVKASPGKLSYASAGSGTVPHLAFELLKLAYKLDIAHVPHRGAGPAVQAGVSGHIPIGITTLPPVLQLHKAGQLRGLAVTSAKRFPTAPDIPTMTEQGIKDQVNSTWQGILLPAGSPKPIADYLFAEITKVVNAPGMRDEFVKRGFTAILSTPAEFAEQIKVEVARWQKVVKEAGVKP
jgi:tripartite-type tricarboxylate transporter receptor subunit TctC